MIEDIFDEDEQVKRTATPCRPSPSGRVWPCARDLAKTRDEHAGRTVERGFGKTITRPYQRREPYLKCKRLPVGHGMAGNSVALRLPAEPSRSARPAFVTAPSLSRTVRHNSLDQHIVESTEEALQFATKLPSAHNHERIRSARLAKRRADTVKTT